MEDKKPTPREEKLETKPIKVELHEAENNLYFDEIRTHTKEETESLPKHCIFSLSDESTSKDHINENHREDSNKIPTSSKTRQNTEVRRHKCQYPHCGKTFKGKDKLNQHSVVHSGNRPFKCMHEGCTSAFKRKSYLDVHMSVHREEKPFFCSWDACGKNFKSMARLRAHLTNHSEAKPFVCPFERCGKGFKRKDALVIHQKVHIPDSSKELIICEYPGCKSTFQRKHSYTAHMQKHTFGRRFRCYHNQCGAAFYWSKELDRHMLIHTGERFFCDYKDCQSSFSAKHRLKIHQETHTGKIYSCTRENCAKTFRCRDSLRKHIGRHLAEKKLTDGEAVPLKKFDKSKNSNQSEAFKFNDTKELQEHLEPFGNSSSFEFVGVNQVNSENNVAVEVKLELEEEC